MKKIGLLILSIAFAISCQKKDPSDKTTPQNQTTKDSHSFSNPAEAVVKHLDLDIKVDFDKQTISGKASWTIDNITKGTEIIFDENTLNITKVTLGNDEKETQFKLGDSVEFHGRPLRITIDPNTTKVNIYYNTTKDGVALQWLKPEQTADKKKPFVFSQGQSIWTRTWIPCQDSPGVRFTYNAKVSVPKDVMALMSAVNPQQKNDTGVYTFSTSHQFRSDVSNSAVISTATLSNKTITSGVFDADDATFTSVSGANCEALIIFADTGVQGTSRLVAYIDSATGLPILPNGGDITVAFSAGANRIFSL